jgi:predicted regulator of Ras-like GTPase activity (Roadblock/LC7/MglB family)
MGFLSKLIKTRERARLEAAVREEPSAGVFLQLARLLQEDGELSQARGIARRGVAAFPKDAELVRIERDLVALERDAECRRLREQIANFPNGRLYARLAELYRAGNEADKAVQVARSGLAGFPDHDGLHYAMGLLLADRGASEEACKHLARAAELDRFNYSALKLLGQLLGALGRHAEAAEAFARIRGFAPDDEEIKELHDRAAEAGGAGVAPSGPKSVAVAPAASGAPAPVPAPAEAAPPAEKPGGANSLMAIALSRLVGKDGIEGAILVDAAGLSVAAALPAGQNEETAAAAVSALRRVASPVCGELGLGSFEEAAFESAGGGMFVYAIRDLSLGIYAAPRSRAAMIGLHVRGLAKKVAGMETEGPRP